VTIEGYLRRWRVTGAIGAVLLAVGLLGVACGGDDSSGSTAATTSPEQKQSTDAEVSAGLKALPALVVATVAAVGTSNAEARLDAIEESWRTYEGTVRAKEQELYLQIEDGFGSLKQAVDAKDAAAAAAARKSIEDAANEYLAKHP
jgi:hypothetical protein